MRFHDLLHTAATLAAVAGATTRELMERLGHSTPVMAVRYQHVLSERKSTLAATLDRFANEAMEIEGGTPVVLELGRVESGSVIQGTRRVRARTRRPASSPNQAADQRKRLSG